MSVAADFRKMAREALRGKWGIAVLVGLVAAILGGAEGMGPELKLNVDNMGANLKIQFLGQTFFPQAEV